MGMCVVYTGSCLGRRHDDASSLTGTSLQIILCQESSLSCRIANDHTSFLGGLNVGLEITANSVTDCHE
jgi:hypothetical protein